ncbi:hypothetical protein O1Q98_03840 [Dickeya lacustris]|uniref:Uncharacterized protein n=1 Tax=Dickeya lacustris TaxID=2259638 RepID=A0ABY8G928_9GAMM|nr:hypothetical protein [Dickeya lacustris]WFN56441.1 hypothetical protein O1Q98_03840 [Dickeya lacustris]
MAREWPERVNIFVAQPITVMQCVDVLRHTLRFPSHRWYEP